MMSLNDAASVVHLIRHLNNPRALRRNLLASPFFRNAQGTSTGDAAAAEWLNAIVLDAIESLKKPQGTDFEATHALRQYTIMREYDLARRPRSEVAANLGIVISTLYLERRVALKRLADAIRVQAPPLASVRSVRDDALEYADCLAAAGQFEACIRLLRNIATAQEPAIRLDALRHLVEVFVKSRNAEGAVKCYKQMHSDAIELPAMREHRAIVKAELHYAKALVHSGNGETKKALTELRAVRHLLVTAELKTMVERSLLISVLQLMGGIHNDGGSLDEPVDLFRESLRIMDNVPNASVRMRIQSLVGLSFAFGALPGQMQAASELSSTALELAKRTGFLSGIGMAHSNECALQFWRGNYKAALHHAAIAQPIADVTFSNIEAGSLALLHARAEAACISVTAARRRLLKTRELLPGKSYLWAMTFILEAEFATRRNADGTALRAAKAAVEAAEMAGNPQAYGCAKMIVAECYRLQHCLLEAKTNAKEAIPLLERHGSAFALAQALTLWARLTGNRSDLGNATELTRGLRA